MSMAELRASSRLAAILFALATAALADSVAVAQEVTSPFRGGAVPSGTVKHEREGDRHILVLSNDFSIHEEPPDPHWRVVDTRGNVFLLDKLKVQGRVNSRITLPGYITSVAKVEMWCAFAETVLGTAEFAQPVDVK
jgi:hypothetical protein